MRNLAVAIAVALGCGSLTIAAPTALAAVSCVSSAHYVDAAHDGSSCTTLPATLGEKWSVKVNGFASYPVIGDGKVFLTTSIPGGPDGGWLYALNASDGSQAWGPIPISGAFWYYPLAFDHGHVFVNNIDGKVVAFDANTGRLLWVQTTAQASGEPVAVDGVVYLQSHDVAWGLSETTGKVLWTSNLKDGAGSQLAVDGTGVYINTGCSRFRLSLTDGTILWSQNQGCTGGGSGVSWLGDGRFFERTFSHILLETTGRALGSFTGTPAFTSKNAYIASGTSLSAESVKSLTPLFTTTLPNTIGEGPAIANQTVYVAASNKKLYAISTANGRITQTLRLPGAPYTDQYDRNVPQDLNLGDNLLVVPTGKTVSAFG